MSPDARHDEYRLPDRPAIGHSIRSALADFYFNSWRLVPANAMWGVGLIAAVLLLFGWPFGSLILLVLLGLPTAGIYRLAALIVRDRPVAFSDAIGAWRQSWRPGLAIAAGVVGITSVLLVNLVTGFTSAEPLGWALGTLAAWGLMATWAAALLLWPLAFDPVREGQPMLARLQVAATLIVLSPLRVGALLLLMVTVLVLSAILFAALITISVAFVALVTTRYVLPAADRLEGRKTKLVPG